MRMEKVPYKKAIKLDESTIRLAITSAVMNLLQTAVSFIDTEL